MTDHSTHIRVPQLGPAEFDQTWSGVRKKRRTFRRRRSRARWAVVLSAASAISLLGLIVGAPPSSPTVLRGIGSPKTIATRSPIVAPTSALTQGTDVVHSFGEGSVRTTPGSKLHQCEGGGRCFQLIRGQATFSSSGEQIVHAGPIAIAGEAAVFVVRRQTGSDSDVVEIAATHNAIDVTRGDDTYRLAAGESMRLEVRDRTSRRTPKQRTPAPSADMLWNEAREARRSNRVREAARLYAKLIAGHPNDRRVGIAALELARLRMDTFHEPQTALEPLLRALDDHHAFVREDALARLIRVHASQGAMARCRRRRDDYMRRFPKGVHHAAVAGACDG